MQQAGLKSILSSKARRRRYVSFCYVDIIYCPPHEHVIVIGTTVKNHTEIDRKKESQRATVALLFFSTSITLSSVIWSKSL